MDIVKVNIVVNYDCPQDCVTLLHRIARTGRFDRRGLAITFVTTTRDKMVLEEFQERYDTVIEKLPEELTDDFKYQIIGREFENAKENNEDE